MRDDLLNNYLHRIGARHSADSSLHRAIQGMSDVAVRAQAIRRERGPTAASAVIRGELIPQFMGHAGTIKAALDRCTDPCVRDDYATGIGASVHYGRVLRDIGRVSAGEWGLIESDARKAAAA